MMRICSLLIFLFSLATPCMAAGENFRDFILTRNGSEAQAAKCSSLSKDEVYCFQTTSHLICAAVKIYPQLTQKSFLQQQAQRELALTTHRLVAEELLALAEVRKKGQYRYDTYFNGMATQTPFYIPSSVESKYFIQGDCMTLLMSVSCKEAVSEINEKMRQEPFRVDYRQTLFSLVKKYFNEKKYEDSIYALKLLFNEDPKDIDAHLFLALTFLYLGKKKDSVLIANNILKDFGNHLSAGQAEQLGDLFLALDIPTEAEKAFGMAIDRQFNHNGEN